jgi:hypothetical protein
VDYLNYDSFSEDLGTGFEDLDIESFHTLLFTDYLSKLF